MIRFEVRLAGYKGYREDDIQQAAAKPEPERSRTLRRIRQETMNSLRENISIYRKVARELHSYRREHAGQEIPNCSAPVHTSMSLKYAHIYNDFGHLELLDSLPQQADLFDAL